MAIKKSARALFGLLLSVIATATWAQGYPNRPIRLLVGFTAGGNADLTARVIGAKLAQALGTNIVVENRTGAAGSIAANIVARAPADGYTLMLASPGALAVNRILEKNLPYDPDTAFVPIGLAATFCNALIARQDFAVSSVAQLIALAKAAVLGGELQLTFASVIGALALRPRLKVLAVTSPARDPTLPDAPTLDESGLKGYDATFWFGLAAPAGTPWPIITRLNTLLRAAVSDAEVAKNLQREGVNPAPSSPQELTARMRADYVKWKRVIEGS